MPAMTTLKVLLVAPPLISAAAFLATSALVIVRQRPLLLRGGLALWFMAIAVAPVIVATFLPVLSGSDPALTCLGLAEIGAFALLVAVLRRSLRGYLVIAVTEESFRAALKAALAGLGLPFEETVLGFRLSAAHDILRTRVEARLGTAQFHMKSSADSEVLGKIAERVRDHLRTDAYSASLGSALIFGATGLLFLVVVLYQAGRF